MVRGCSSKERRADLRGPAGTRVFYRSVRLLRRALYLQAAVWALAGTALTVAPALVTEGLFAEPPAGEPAWLRIVGIQAFGLALLMVLVAHRADELWWWSWAFALVAVGVAAVATLNAAFGLEPGQSTLFWWLFAGVTIALAFTLLAAVYVTAQENPLP
jgi:hypothetical protein